MPTRKDNPLVSKPDPHLADNSPWRKRQSRVLPRQTYRYRHSSISKRKPGFIPKALFTLVLSVAFAFVLLEYGQPYMERYVKPYLEKVRAELLD